MDQLNVGMKEKKSGHVHNLTAASKELLLKQRFKKCFLKEYRMHKHEGSGLCQKLKKCKMMRSLAGLKPSEALCPEGNYNAVTAVISLYKTKHCVSAES